MLTPCNPCICPGAPCEQCIFGYKSREEKHRLMKQLIESVNRGEKPNGYLIARRYKIYHNNWEEQMEE